MIFTYNEKAGDKEIILDNDSFIHLFKSRRTQVGKKIEFRNLKDNYKFFYKVEEVKKKKAILVLEKKEKIQIKKIKRLHIAWCVIDPKSIKEALPYLNQLGLDKITFINCDRSQKNFSLKLEKLEKILISSSEQCGRNDLMKIEFKKKLDEFLLENNNVYLFDFNGKDLNSLGVKEKEDIKIIFVGPEGGISESERLKFVHDKIISLNRGLVLKSETATIFLASTLIC